MPVDSVNRHDNSAWKTNFLTSFWLFCQLLEAALLLQLLKQCASNLQSIACLVSCLLMLAVAGVPRTLRPCEGAPAILDGTGYAMEIIHFQGCCFCAGSTMLQHCLLEFSWVGQEAWMVWMYGTGWMTAAVAEGEAVPGGKFAEELQQELVVKLKEELLLMRKLAEQWQSLHALGIFAACSR